MDLVPLAQQELGEVAAVLARDTGGECLLGHVGSPMCRCGREFRSGGQGTGRSFPLGYYVEHLAPGVDRGVF